MRAPLLALALAAAARAAAPALRGAETPYFEQLSAEQDAARGETKMECGSGVSLCGVLTLCSGLGSGAYEHPAPSVHGLWPEVGSYGTSQCIAPSGSKADPTSVVDCYSATDDDSAAIISFETHEWDKHGQCAAAIDAEDFLTTVCDLAEKPLALMATTRTAGGSLDDMKAAVEHGGYEVFGTDATNSQLLLSACASSDKKWQLAAVADFPTACGDWAFNSAKTAIA